MTATHLTTGGFYCAGKSFGEILTQARDAARDGAETCKTLAAKKGRAAALGQKSVGFNDPGAAEACKESGCALIGGETAEMSGFYSDGEYDIAGFAVGVVERKNLITPARVKVGDVLIGLPSSGLHSNGFSLVRKIVFERMKFTGTEKIDGLDKTLGAELLTPTRLYPATVLPLIREFGDKIHGLVHVTGGGFYDNIPRALPEGLGATIDADSWAVPTIFKLLQTWGNVERHEIFRTFNCGISIILIVDASIADSLTGYKIGRVVEGDGVTIN